MEPEISFEELIAELSLRVRIFRDAKNPVELPAGLGEVELTLLEYIFLVGGESNTSELGKFFEKVHKSTISTNIERLRSKKLIKRTELPEDRRVKVVRITPKGVKALEKIREERHEKMFKYIVMALNIESDEIPTLSYLIKKAIDNLDSMLGFSADGDKKPMLQGAPKDTG